MASGARPRPPQSRGFSPSFHAQVEDDPNVKVKIQAGKLPIVPDVAAPAPPPPGVNVKIKVTTPNDLAMMSP